MEQPEAEQLEQVTESIEFYVVDKCILPILEFEQPLLSSVIPARERKALK